VLAELSCQGKKEKKKYPKGSATFRAIDLAEWLFWTAEHIGIFISRKKKKKRKKKNAYHTRMILYINEKPLFKSLLFFFLSSFSFVTKHNPFSIILNHARN
jgi:hypothetical protein